VPLTVSLHPLSVGLIVSAVLGGLLVGVGRDLFLVSRAKAPLSQSPMNLR
jgi:hypothetical protein